MGFYSTRKYNIILPIFVIFTLLLSSSCSNDKKQDIELIAHAGGEIEGHIYTNSLEAIKQSIERGYKYIEIDLALTADSVLVAVHDWEEFNRITGNPHKKDTIPSLEEFQQRIIHGKYTPLTAEQINQIFIDNETLYLVTDKISNPEILEQNFPNLKQRMVVEAFNYPEYNILCSQGYFRVLYSRLASDFRRGIEDHLLLHFLHRGHKIKWIATHPGAFQYGILRAASIFTDFNFAIYTINNWNDIPQKDYGRTKMIYTDRIVPQ